MSLRSMAPGEFARRLKLTAEETDKRFAFFVGAGCSISSGIPAAGDLVAKHWLPRLRDLRAPGKDLEEWAKEELDDYDPANAAAHYGPVMERLFVDNESRQREIERLCDGTFPAFGYAVLAGLMPLQRGCFNVALTTNFDDLIADALYLFTESRPLVILHESLAPYIRTTRTRPLVVKLHGDHRLSPQNTTEETERLKEGIESQVRSLLHDRGLIFIGYGGNDRGIAAVLDKLPPDALPLGVYWINLSEPQGILTDWLDRRQAICVQIRDFDEIMVLIKDECDLQHPDRRRFEKLFDRYFEKYKSLSGQIASLPDTTPDASALKAAARRVDESFPDWFSVFLAAKRLQTADPDRAEAIYEEGLKDFPESLSLSNNYGGFLQHVRKDSGRAEEMYRRALGEDPDDADVRANLAGLLLSRDSKSQEGWSLLTKVLKSRYGDWSPGLAAESWFYAFAHQLPDQQLDALRGLRQVLLDGVRSSDWDFSQNIERAREDGHPDVAWLEKLAAVITQDADISTLDPWDKWQDL